MNQPQQPTTLAAIKNPAPREQNMPAVTMGFGSLQSFELMQRAAKMLAHSTLVPVAYRTQKEVKEYGKVVGYEDQPSALPNCVVALNMAQRMGADPLMVMQNLYIVEGRPSWSSQFIIAAINSCGRYTPLRFMLSEPSEPRDIEYVETKWVKGNKTEVKRQLKVANRTCVAWAIEKETGERLESPEISIDMAIAEGWLTKNGSKWQTMPEVMLRYRAAAFFGKLYAPELLMGLQTAEEAADIIDIDMPEAQPRQATDLNQLRTPPQGSAVAPAQEVDEEDDDKPDTTEGQAGEPGAPEAGMAAGPAGETSQQAAQGQQQDDGQAQGLSYAKVRDSLEKAGDLEVLDVAADLIGEVADKAQQEELRAFYRERKEALSTQPAAAGTTTRRAKAQQQNFNVE